MSAIGTLVFCTDCGNLLDGSTGNINVILTCDCCGAQNQDTASSRTETKTKPSSFPSALRQQRSSIQTIERSDLENKNVTYEPCPKCGRTEVKFVALQLRSADEGSTIFFNCDCGNKWTANN